MTTQYLSATARATIESLHSLGKYSEMYAVYAVETGSVWAGLASRISANKGNIGTYAREYMSNVVGTNNDEFK